MHTPQPNPNPNPNPTSCSIEQLRALLREKESSRLFPWNEIGIAKRCAQLNGDCIIGKLACKLP